MHRFLRLGLFSFFFKSQLICTPWQLRKEKKKTLKSDHMLFTEQCLLLLDEKHTDRWMFENVGSLSSFIWWRGSLLPECSFMSETFSHSSLEAAVLSTFFTSILFTHYVNPEPVTVCCGTTSWIGSESISRHHAPQAIQQRNPRIKHKKTIFIITAF